MAKRLQLTRRQLLQACAVCTLLPLLSCTTDSSPLKLSGHAWPSYELLFLAQEMGWLDPSNIELVQATSASASMQALREGTVQGAMLTLDESIRLLSEGLALKAVLVFNVSVGADAVFVRAGIEHPEQLYGKTIGYEDSALGVFMFEEFLTYHQLDKHQIKTVHVTADQHVAVWQAGGLDALITFEPSASQLVKTGAKKLFTSRQIPNKIFDVLVVNTAAVEQKPAALRHVTELYFRALQHLRLNPMDASHRMTNRLEMQAEEVIQLYRGLLLPDASTNYDYLSGQDPHLLESSQALIKVMRNKQIIGTEAIDLPAFFTPEFIPRALL